MEFLTYEISGPVTFGTVGWALDLGLNIGFFLPVGILAGTAASLYLVWVRYGTEQ